MRFALVACLILTATALAGCTSEDPQAESSDLPSMAPTAYTGDIPPCALEPGDWEWPDIEASPLPSGPVEAEIKWDAFRVPHIYADDRYSLWYANGYVQAQERLFQLDLLRLIGFGESARYLGEGQLVSDMEVQRDLYSRDEIEAQWQAAPDAGKQILQAYADGVNRYMMEARVNGEWPSEFAAIGRDPPAWEPQDSVAIIDYLIGYFGVAGGKELDNLATMAELDASLGGEAAWQAFGDMNWLRLDDTYTSFGTDKLINGCEDPLPFDEATQQLASIQAAKSAVAFGMPDTGELGLGGILGYDATPGSGLFEDFHWGSNAFLADGSITDTGKPIMWGAPQMGYYKPPIPFQVGLHGPGYDAVGIGVAGAPGLVIGRNADIAWTATSGIEDQVDLVEIDLTGPRTYLWDGDERPMMCRMVEHQTAPAPADYASTDPPTDPPMVYTQEICKAEGWSVVAINEAAGKAWFRKTTTLNEELPGALMWLGVATASSVEEFHEHVADFPFTFNFFVADDESVLQIHTGDIPLRAPGYDPRLPTPSGAVYDWRGEAYTGEMQTFLTDPSRGYIANWNNAPAYGWRAGDEAGLWGPVQRVQMIDYWTQRALAEDGTLSMEDIQDINWQAATHDSYALPFMPSFIEAADDADAIMVPAALGEWATASVPWRDADGDGIYDDPGHGVWDHVITGAFDAIMGDELGAATKQVVLEPDASANGSDHGTLNNEFATLLKILRGSAEHDWCDDVTTPDHETCSDVLEPLLDQAQLFAVDASTPIHTSKFLPLGGAVADERPMINRGSWVQMVSMADPGSAVGILPPSNSGQVTAADLALIAAGMEPEHLHGELDLYWSNQFKPLPLTAPEVEAVAVAQETLTIVPLL